MECGLLVIGCGNLLRGDDGVGPILVRHLWERGVPPDVRLVDGGTAGMDVSFQMRGARRVILVDAAATGAEPGTVFRVPGPAVEDLPGLDGLHTHSFRWDHALAFGRWLLGDDYPADVTVYLIEAADVAAGAPLSPAVEAALHQVLDLVLAEPEWGHQVEFTESGHLRLDAALATARFADDAAVAQLRDGELWLLPLRSSAAGGLLLKQRTPEGDRGVLVREVLADDVPVGPRTAHWDDAAGALRITLRPGR